MNDHHVKEQNLKVNDFNLERKKNATNEVHFFGGFPLPSIIEISESGTCNRKCSFCPRSAADFIDRKEFIETDLIEKIANELAQISYRGLILFSGFVEPLLDKNIAQKIKIFFQAVPDAQIELVTNGDPITLKVLDKLAESGLSKLLISCYDGEWQIDELKSLIGKSLFSLDNVIFRPRWMGEDENFGISLSNRGGLMENAEYRIENLLKAWENPCFYPAQTFFIDYQGDVLLCAHDWGKKYIAGNICDSSIIEIWTGQKFDIARRALLAGNRHMQPCKVCNVEGTRMGSSHAEAWEQIFDEE